MTPSALANDRLSPRLDGANGGDGRNGVTGDDDTFTATGTALVPARDDVGDVWVGRDGRDGPPGREESGEFCRRDGEGECVDGEPEDRVDDLKGLIVFMAWRRMGRAP